MCVARPSNQRGAPIRPRAFYPIENRHYRALVTVPPEAMKKAGVGRDLATGSNVDWPVHGLRHPPKGDTSGWFIWTGEMTEDSDFFVPMHPIHLFDRVPGLAQELAAPPGTRFLIAPDYRDTWYEEGLLE